MTSETQEQTMMQSEPQAEHQWLHKLVGDWTFEAEYGEPGKPPDTSSGRERVRSLGGLWIVAEGEGEMPGGGESQSIMTLGYDPQKGRFVGTFIASVMANLWVYDGELAADGRKLTLYTEGPAMSGDGTTAPYMETMEFESDDHRIFSSHVKGDDGRWQRFMTSHYRRTR